MLHADARHDGAADLVTTPRTKRDRIFPIRTHPSSLGRSVALAGRVAEAVTPKRVWMLGSGVIRIPDESPPYAQHSIPYPEFHRIPHSIFQKRLAPSASGLTL
ncbi:hypothetical protein EVG20_g9196 [Dentipellis fragilis]|uniref:Uncharacterized protein n=1 Tax=Dentipellis fragilis TaxID=205917 RepID=A0A4Y9XZV7_9AGAM|nr:hypothetical protein EVG20_g9196 [Dentipellis fragilis]